MVSQYSCDPATADFEYSKDWLATDSHRLSFYHVQSQKVLGLCGNYMLSQAPAGLFIPLFLREINTNSNSFLTILKSYSSDND